MSSRILLIIPYFGKFHNYFQLWLQSCKHNASINWLLLTDDKTPYLYPSNVQVIYTTFEQIVQQIQSCYDFQIVLEKPYQLCEFKVGYGEIFSNYTKGFDFWGHCDIDVIWGNLRRHLTENILQSYSKISWRGHLTLYKNNDRINSLYRKPIDGIEFYKYAFSNISGFPLAPDERAINYLYKAEGEPVYTNLIFADLKIRNYGFSLLHFQPEEDYKNQHQIFMWEKGNLYRLYVSNDKVFKEDFCYIHFLKRPMKMANGLNFQESFLIVPNEFINLTKPLNISIIKELAQNKFYWSYVLQRLKPSYLINKIKYAQSKSAFKNKYRMNSFKTVRYELPPIKSLLYNEKLNDRM